MSIENIEIQIAKQTVELLKQYAAAKTQEEKDSLLSQIRSANLGVHIVLTKRNYDPLDLAAKIDKAIQLDQYRPKNMSILQLAISDDLDHVGGDFNTFDMKLSQMIKNKEEPEKIRDRFIGGTANIYVLAKQFSADWIRRLKEHKELADAARNASEENIIDAYNKLFDALTKDFCKEHDCHIDSKVITDWENSDVKPNGGYDITNGFHKHAFTVDHPSNISKTEKKKLVDEFIKNPEEHPNAYKTSIVRINITNVKKHHPDKNDFFYSMIRILAHEIHHALDYQKPRQGALGPQIQYIDRATYVPAHIDDKAYHESATEISSYQIDHELFNQLKKLRF